MRKKIKKPSLSNSQVVESLLNMYMGKVSTVNEDIDILFIMPDATAPTDAEALCRYFLSFDKKHAPEDKAMLAKRVRFRDPISHVHHKGRDICVPTRLSLFILTAINWPDENERGIILGYVIDTFIRLSDNDRAGNKVKYYTKRLGQLIDHMQTTVKQ